MKKNGLALAVTLLFAVLTAGIPASALAGAPIAATGDNSNVAMYVIGAVILLCIGLIAVLVIKGRSKK